MKRAVELPQTDDESNAPGTIAESAYRRFRRDILSGRLGPDSPLRSDDLRKAYDVGVSPLREALSRLVSERLVVASAQRGFRVAPLSVDDVMDTLQARLLIEREALSRSIDTRDVEWEAQLLSSYHRLSRIPVPSAPGPESELWRKHHREFHSALLAGCGSRWLQSLASSLFDHAERHRQIAIGPTTKSKRSAAKEHSAIVTAALAGDKARALDMLEAHFSETARMVVDELSSQDARGKAAAPRAQSRRKVQA